MKASGRWGFVRPRSRTLILALAAVLLLAACGGRTTGTSQIKATMATLNLLAHCNSGESCKWYFEYWVAGQPRASGHKTPELGPVNGATPDVALSMAVSGLQPNTSYRWVACGSPNNGAGYVCVGPKGTISSSTADPPADFETFTTATSSLPPGFTDSVVFSGLTLPTAVRFSPDGRVFVAEKSGVIKVFDSLTSTTPKVFADLSASVHHPLSSDRGLLGLALDPNFPAQPYVYVLYTYDAKIGGTAPLWPVDSCPSPPGNSGCVVSGRLSRLQANGDAMTGTENVLVNDWCQQFASHSIGDLAFGSDGALYASAGEGADYTTTDYGQFAANPCNDPPAGPGVAETIPASEGGSLRSQSLRRTAGQPATLDGTLIRVNPATGAGLPDNPLANSPDPNLRRIVGYGLRNPFRFAIRPGTSEVWLGNVGWETAEAIDVVNNPIAQPVKNFGWPCYEGSGVQPVWQRLGLDMCQSLYSAPGQVTAPFYSYQHTDQVVPGEGCPADQQGTVISGLAFQSTSGDPYPPEYDGALFFADYDRGCIWAMERNGSGLPSPANIKTFQPNAANPVDLQIGPGGDLYYVDYVNGEIHRIHYAPTASGILQASQSSVASRHKRGSHEIFATP